MPPVDEVAPWVALVATILGLIYQGYTTFKNRKKERTELEAAVRSQPLIEEQLRVGNFEGAVKVLNMIIEQQNAHIARQDQRLTAVEAESSGWQQRANNAALRADEAERKAERLEGLVALLNEKVQRCEEHMRTK